MRLTDRKENVKVSKPVDQCSMLLVLENEYDSFSSGLYNHKWHILFYAHDRLSNKLRFAGDHKIESLLQICGLAVISF